MLERHAVAEFRLKVEGPYERDELEWRWQGAEIASLDLMFRESAALAPLVESSLPGEIVSVALRQHQDFAALLKRLGASYALGEHRIMVDFVRSPVFNALCRPEGRGDIVTINSGVYVWSYVISCLIRAATRDKRSNDDFRDYSFLMDVREYELMEDREIASVLREYSNYFNVDAGVSRIAAAVTDAVWLHEISHSLLGHSRYAQAALKYRTGLGERPSGVTHGRDWSPRAAARRRYLEWEADRFAGTLNALRLSQREAVEDIHLVEALTFGLYGQVLLVSAFQTANEQASNLPLYPSPLCRFLCFQMGVGSASTAEGATSQRLIDPDVLAAAVKLCFEMTRELADTFPAVVTFDRFAHADFKNEVVDEYMSIASTPEVVRDLTPLRHFGIVVEGSR